MINEVGSLKNYWYAVARSQEVSSKPLAITVMELPLVLWRNKKGLSAMLDRCCHRNAPLSKGHIKDDCIVCPYHGWTYNSDGECTDIPSEGPHSDNYFNKKVESFPVQEQDDLIWVWMGREQEVDKHPFKMPIPDGKGWKYYYMTTWFDNDITNLVENFMDVPHTAFVHKGWFRNQRQTRVPMHVKQTSDSVHVNYLNEDDQIGASSWLVNPKGLPMKHSDNFYMPANTVVDYIFGEEVRGFVISSTCTPVAKRRTKVFTLICYKFGLLTPLAGLFLPAYTRKVIQQDVWIMKLQGDNLERFGAEEFHSTKVDTLHIYIEALRMAAESGKPTPQPTSSESEFWI